MAMCKQLNKLSQEAIVNRRTRRIILLNIRVPCLYHIVLMRTNPRQPSGFIRNPIGHVLRIIIVHPPTIRDTRLLNARMRNLTVLTMKARVSHHMPITKLRRRHILRHSLHSINGALTVVFHHNFKLQLMRAGS